MPVKAKCLKYYRNDVGIFWQPGEIYDFTVSDIYEFIRNFQFENWIDGQSSKFGEFLTANIGTFLEYFEPVDQSEFDREISGKKDKINFVSTPITPIGQRRDGIRVADLIAELTDIQSRSGPDVRVFIFEGEYGQYFGVTGAESQGDDGAFIEIIYQ